jgi:hypothetical protein
MSYGDEVKERRAITFRTGLDIGMGLFYTIIGAMVLTYKAFGTMEIPAVIAYILGGMMVIGGIARFYRGLKVILAKNKDSDLQT